MDSFEPQKLPASALVMSRQQIITLAPRFAKSMAVSLPIPVFAPEK